MTDLGDTIRTCLDVNIPSVDSVPYKVQSESAEDGYRQQLIHFTAIEGDTIPAYLLIPEGEPPFPAILVHHQHNAERHLGKSEVVGLVGDPLQGIAPNLAKNGIVVLAPDSICFEDRRRQRQGLEPDPIPELDWLQHYNEMAYRLVQGTTLMKKVLEDSALGISLLAGLSIVDEKRIGMYGHSYGGNTTMFHAPLDARIQFSCASGAVASYQHKFDNDIGLELALVVPSMLQHFRTADLLACVAPRRLLIVSADDDRYSYDAEEIVEAARPTFVAQNVEGNLEHFRYEGGHPLTKERYRDILEWLTKQARA